jgi:hypothetical protein
MACLIAHMVKTNPQVASSSVLSHHVLRAALVINCTTIDATLHVLILRAISTMVIVNSAETAVLNG